MINETIQEVVLHGLMRGLGRRVTYLVPLRVWDYALDCPAWIAAHVIRDLHTTIKARVR